MDFDILVYQRNMDHEQWSNINSNMLYIEIYNPSTHRAREVWANYFIVRYGFSHAVSKMHRR